MLKCCSCHYLNWTDAFVPPTWHTIFSDCFKIKRHTNKNVEIFHYTQQGLELHLVDKVMKLSLRLSKTIYCIALPLGGGIFIHMRWDVSMQSQLDDKLLRPPLILRMNAFSM